MKALVLAGGYGKRLWPLTKNKPKPLLEVGGKPIILYILEKLELVKEVNEIIISTNEKFGDVFKEYIRNYNLKRKKEKGKITLVIEQTNSNGEKLGSIGGIAFVLGEKKINEDLLIIGGDNIFEFDLLKFINYYKLKKKKNIVVALRDLKDKELVKKYGVCLLDKDNRIIDFQEKPLEPKSTLASTACYIFPKNDLKLIFDYLDEGNSPDIMGFLIKWLYKRKNIYGFVFYEDWFDIGSLETLESLKNYNS